MLPTHKTRAGIGVYVRISDRMVRYKVKKGSLSKYPENMVAFGVDNLTIS